MEEGITRIGDFGLAYLQSARKIILPSSLEELGECVSPEKTPEQTVNAKELERAVTAFLKNEPAMRRCVFLRRYFYLEDVPAIAKRYGLSSANVRMMLSRTRQKLKKYLTEGGYSL